MRGILARLLLLLFPLAVVLPSDPALANNTRPDVVGTVIGALDVSAGTSWTSITSGSLRCSRTQATCTAGYVFTQVMLVNTHASQTLYLQLKSAASETSVNQIAVDAGGSITLDLYGQSVTAIAVLGSGATTTGRIVAWLVPN